MARFLRSFWVTRTLAFLVVLATFAPVVAVASPRTQATPLVTWEVRYRNAEAGEAAIVWGVDGWQTMPESQRTAETTIQHGTKGDVMRTRMVGQGGVFVARLQVPADTPVNYIFNITRTRGGATIDAWDMNGIPARDFRTIPRTGSVTDVESTIVLAQQSYTTTSDSAMQVIGSVVLLALCAVLALVASRALSRNPFLDF